MGPFQKQSGMGEIRWGEGIANSVIKREKRKAYPYGVICGCSNSCGFAHILPHIPKPNLETASEHYKKWHKTHEQD
jgi:hypothetical protein